MPEFRGKVRLAGNPLDLIGADIDVSGGTLALIVENQEVGEWPLHILEVESAIDGFHISVDGEKFIFSTREADAFAAALGISLFGSRARKQGRSAKAVTAIKSSGLVQAQGTAPVANPAPPPRAPASRQAPPRNSPAAAPRTARIAPVRKPPGPGPLERVKSFLATKGVVVTRGLVGLALALALVALGVFARPLLAGVLLLVGIAGALLALTAALDPLLATRLPEKWPVSRLAIYAGAMLAAAVVLVAL